VSETDWIIGVRKIITDTDPDITIGELVHIFKHNSPQMDLLFVEFHAGRTPEQAYEALVDKFTETLGAVRQQP
jgi:hypothetical protein